MEALRKKLVAEARKRIFGTFIATDNARTGRKQLKSALLGPALSTYVPFSYHHGFDGVYDDERVLRRQEKLERLRKRGKGPPKKGAGKRSKR
jgi:small subunit ribosomal protein S33